MRVHPFASRYGFNGWRNSIRCLLLAALTEVMIKQRGKWHSKAGGQVRGGNRVRYRVGYLSAVLAPSQSRVEAVRQLSSGQQSLGTLPVTAANSGMDLSPLDATVRCCLQRLDRRKLCRLESSDMPLA